MTYTHLTTDELVIIASYFKNNQSVAKTAQCLGRARQTIHNVYQFLKTGATILNYYQRYKENKKRCGRRSIDLPEEQKEYVQKRVIQGWTPDVIVGRSEMKLDCSVRTLYRMFKDKPFDTHDLPMSGKEFLNWKKISNTNDISIYFADPGTPSQRGLNEHSNGLLRKDGLYKAMDFNGVSETFIQSVASKRNNIPRKSLHYRTPMEVFLSYVTKYDLSNLILQTKYKK